MLPHHKLSHRLLVRLSSTRCHAYTCDVAAATQPAKGNFRVRTAALRLGLFSL